MEKVEINAEWAHGKLNENKYFDLIRNFFLVLLKHDKLENDIFYFETVKDILPLLSSKERMDVLREIQKQKNCPPPEIEKLQRIIDNLNL